MSSRKGERERSTRETRIRVDVNLDEPGIRSIDSGLPFLNHMLDAWACHGKFGFSLSGCGDIEVDPHHLVEDCGICLGAALRDALGDFSGIARAGFFIFPMDSSLARVAIDLCGRPNLVWRAELGSTPIGGIDPRLFRDFFKGLVDHLMATIHVEIPYLDNDHHAVEAVFKAFGRALRQAVTPDGSDEAASTKGVIVD
jgi:imidazoleglycerol-phosphate dehydratase